MSVMLSGLSLRLVGRAAVHRRVLPPAAAVLSAGDWRRADVSPRVTPGVSAAARRSISCSRPLARRRPAPPPAAHSGEPPPPRWEPAELSARLYRLLTDEERLHAVSEQSARAVLHLLAELGFSEREVTEMLLGGPQLLRRGPAAWRAAVPPLLARGWTPQQVAEMLSACPQLLDCGAAQLEELLAALLTTLPASEAALLELARAQPHLLLLSAGRLRRQLGALLTEFTAEQAARVALRCPAVLLERPADTERKLHYLLDVMGLTAAEVAHSSAMAHPLEHLRARHTALERSGGYRRPRRADDTEPTGNPQPTEIFGHSDELFCQRVARLPYREYEVFVRLLQEETDSLERRNSDSDDDSDSDSDLEDSTSSYGAKGRRGR